MSFRSQRPPRSVHARSGQARPFWQRPIVLVTGAAIIGGLLLVGAVSFLGSGKPTSSGSTQGGSNSIAPSIVAPGFSTSTKRADGWNWWHHTGVCVVRDHRLYRIAEQLD